MELASTSEKIEEIPASASNTIMVEVPLVSEGKGEEIPAGASNTKLMEMPSTSKQKAEETPESGISSRMMNMSLTSEEKAKEVPAMASNTRSSIQLENQNSLQTEQNQQASSSVAQAQSVSPQPSTSQFGNINISHSVNTPSYQHGTWQGVLQHCSNAAELNTTTCDILMISKAGTPALEMDNWQGILILDFIPVRRILKKGIFNRYSEGFKTIFIYPKPHSFLENLNKILKHGVVGGFLMNKPCSFLGKLQPFLLFYTGKDRAYLGFIPNNHATFSDALEKILKKKNISQIFEEQVQLRQIYDQPKSLFELSSHIMGDVIAKSVLKVFNKCSESLNSVCAEKSKRNTDQLVASTAEFFDTYIPCHLHDVVTQQSLAAIASLDNGSDFFQNDYNILDIFIRSHVTDIDFSVKIHNHL